ncbi:MAG: BON domain-containing protein [Planctomycetota bacterium]|nr:BON domain-containing protein [Planctomycetota bacterium]
MRTKTRNWRRTLAPCACCFAMLAAAPAWAASELSDAEITDAVVEQLFQDDAVAGYWVDVMAEDGVVTLEGTANNLLAKERAARIVRTIRGVRSVVNRIEVEAPMRTDDEIREDVNHALLFDRATESYEVDVAVDDQQVTLTGDVQSWQEKQLAGRVAKGVRGVKGLTNDIRIDHQTDRPDHEIRAEIEKALDWNVLVDDALIDVSVRDGEVTLTGTVGSASEKTEAKIDAWVAGVRDVEADRLKVARWARDEDLREGKYVARDDAEINKAIRRALRYDPRVDVDDVKVKVEDGVVTLNGKTDHVMAKRSAAQDARNTVGVWRVKNLIRVRASSPSDATIENRIERALARDPYVESYELTVRVENGEATLLGAVDSFFEKARADNIAAATYGVVDVNNNVRVDDPDEYVAYDPYIDGYVYIYDYDWHDYPDLTTTETDWEIREDIQDEMWWSPFVDEDEVTVTVDGGVATLTGTVDTWSERRAATENAYEGGAILVDNDLMVDYGPDYYND